MLVGAIVGASFVLLLLVCEALSGFLWHDTDREKYFYCPECDLCYVRNVHKEVGSRICRAGHPIRTKRRFPWIPALITACATFICLSTVQLVTGIGNP